MFFSISRRRVSSDLDLAYNADDKKAFPQNVSTTPATDAVLRTPELVELIFLHLSPRQLFAIQRVCSTTRNTALSTPSLRAKMLLDYHATQHETPEERALDPPVLEHVVSLRETAGTFTSDYVEKLSGLGVGGAAREVRCLQILMPCPLCQRASLPTSRTFFRRKKTQPPAPCIRRKEVWGRIKLAQRNTCTVVAILRTDTEGCGHYRAVRRRLCEFPPAQGTVVDLEMCLQDFMRLDEAGRSREDLHFGRAKLATYVWSRGNMHAGIKQAMNPVGVGAAAFRSRAPPLFICTMGEGLFDDIMDAMRPDPEYYRA